MMTSLEPERMAECAGAAVHVELFVRDAELLHGDHRHLGKRLVDLEQIHIAHLPAQFRE